MARPFEHSRPELAVWGRAEPRVLILPEAGQGPQAWAGVGRALAARGIAAACLAYPGHGALPWSPPPQTGLRDYALLAARAAGGLGRPLLVGQGLGGWLAQRLLEWADLPALLLAPWPTPLAARAPRLAWRLLRGRPWGAAWLVEPAALRWQAALGLAGGAPRRRGRAPCLVAAREGDAWLPPAALAGCARRLGAEMLALPASAGSSWREPALVLALLAKLAARL